MIDFDRLLPSVMLALAMSAASPALAPAYAQDAGVDDATEGEEQAGDEPAEPQDAGPIDEIVVRGQFIPDEKRATSEITSVLDAEDFVRAGDSDIAAALSRVTGLSVNDGRFIIVRGLNERYSSATLNGLPLPSTEPLRRAAPLDLFPTSVIQSSTVVKTFSPELSGEFGGGLVQLETKSRPDEDFLEIGIKGRANTETTLKQGYFYEGSDSDVFGFDDGLRDLPDAAALTFTGDPLGPDQQNAVDTAFEQYKTLLITRDDVPFDGGASLAAGKRFDGLGPVDVGTVLYLGYDNEWENRDGVRNRPNLDAQPTSSFFSTRQNITLSGLSSTGLEFANGDEVTLTGIYVRSSLKQAEIEEGSSRDTPDFRQESTDWIERELWQAQLVGDHEVDFGQGLGVAWRVAYGEALRDAPYNRQTNFYDRGGIYRFSEGDGQSYINNSFLQDENFAAALDLSLPVELGAVPLVLKAGGGYTDSSRSTQRRDFEFRGDFPDEVQLSRPDLIFSDPVMGLSGPFLLLNSSRGFPDNFDGSLEVASAYVSAEAEFGPYVRASGGVRFEDGSQDVSTFVTDEENSLQTFPAIEEDYFLPAVTVTWNPLDDFQLRGAYSKTITRPQFRELGPSIFIDPDTDVAFFGNPYLVNSEIDNFDLRAEYYFGTGQFVTVGLFYKDIQNPIEETITTQGNVFRTTFVNAPSAELWGVELEFEKTFDLYELTGGSPFGEGKEIVFKTNYTYTDAQVSNDGEVTVARTSGQGITPNTRDAANNILDESPLTGQSEHLFNFQLGVRTDNGASATILANYASERTLFRGQLTSQGFDPAVMQKPGLTLDAVINQPFEFAGGNFDLTLKVQNVTERDYDAYFEESDRLVGSPAFQTYDVGRLYYAGLRYQF
ncbi:TonB-dependent receptor domain-containing protein [Parvularcula dongshanensis]|uniref:Outer membrane receptor protein involved in Fe transport n=1 Tax=Parvularcula dongshanensis TaxID=1173995 RepID=A0A840HYW3_9PROT|nr:TonB-dependent receptor [Parvularcula dongshanensis]MBB4657627.1 outer membrane receptor protein involved in Fe transport [Parvularcula dongshanensis]